MDYLDNIEIIKNNSTWIEAKCPVCNGRLKISKNPSKYGAYACYTEECHSKSNNLIRKKLYKPFSPFNRSNIYTKPELKRKITHILVKRLELDFNIDKSIDYTSFLTNISFLEPIEKVYNNRYVYKKETYYNYNSFLIVRNDILLKKSNERSKYFYPIYYKDNNIVKGLPDMITLPIYRKDYIQESVIFVEGEKCATILQSLGIASITLAHFTYTERYLDRYINNLYLSGVRNVIYLMDNDEVGLHKAKLVTNFLAKNSIKSRYINIVDIEAYKQYTEIKRFDVYDLYEEGLVRKDTVNQFVNNLINYLQETKL